MILSIRTDNKTSEIGLYKKSQKIDYYSWRAHYQLAETIHANILSLLAKNHLGWRDLTGVVANTGPGSFTGLRIGLATANALAYGLNIPSSGNNGINWQLAAIKSLPPSLTGQMILPVYDEPAVAK